MAVKPVANALTQELEPVVERLMDHHLNTEELWFAHEYVPFERARTSRFWADVIGTPRKRACPG